MIKIIAVGNVLLSDDGIGIRVCKELEDKISNINKNIEVIIGGTNYLYCLDKINNDDLVIVVDSTYFMIRPGVVITRSFEECDDFLQEHFTSHEESLLKILRRDYREIKGYLIGIEVKSIEYSLDISKTLKRKFDSICSNVFNQIEDILIKECNVLV